LYRYDITGNKWFKIESIGDVPLQREGHVCKIIDNDKMILHGGIGQFADDFYSYDDTYVLTDLSMLDLIGVGNNTDSPSQGAGQKQEEY
jgi:N-acetylneuraminic acid mutarotase